MKNIISTMDRLAGMIVGLGLLVVGTGFMVLGVSFLPVVGIFMGVAVLRLAWHFMTPKAIVFERTSGVVYPEGWDDLAKIAGAAA